MDLQSVKFVNIYQKDNKGKNVVAVIPITSPQKIRAYIDMGDLQPENFANNDHGWRLDPGITAQVRDIMEEPDKLERIAREMGLPLDIIKPFHVFMYEVQRNRALALKAQANSLDKQEATADYERQVSEAREKPLKDEK